MRGLKPMAYRFKNFDDNKAYLQLSKPSPTWDIVESLYTKEQLQPRVKMTKKQHKQFEEYKVDKNNFYHFWQSLLVDDVSLFKEIPERDLMLAWLDEEAIEIVPEKKWFVVISESYKSGNVQYMEKPKFIYDGYSYAKENGAKFDTKEQAEEWTNPLTEAVLLPVEE